MKRGACAALVMLLCATAHAQQEGETGEGPEQGDPTAAKAPPRPVIVTDLPDVPAKPPDRFAVMLFTNESGAKAMDWAVSAVPFALGEKVAHVLELEPTFGPLVVPDGPAIEATPTIVAQFAKRMNAQWVFTGWVQRPQFELKIGVILWQYDGVTAKPLGLETIRRGPVADMHRLIGDAVLELAARAKWTIPDGALELMAKNPARDIYAYQLMGRGLGELVGAVGDPDRKAAEHDLSRALLIDPKLPEGQRLMGELYATDPDPHVAAKAVGKFAYAADLAPDYDPAVRSVADAAAAAGKNDQARELYMRLAQSRPWDLDLRFRLGDAMWKSGDADGALRELGRVVARSPDDLRARRVLALIHAAHGDMPSLAKELEEIVARAPDDVDARADLGAAYVALGRLQDATTAYETVASKRPNDANDSKRVADVWRMRKDTARAVQWYAKASQIDPTDPRPFFLTGDVWIDAGNLDEAHKAYVRAETFKDYLGQSYGALASIAYAKGNLSEAQWYLRRAAKARPWSRDLRWDYALVLCSLKDWAGAGVQLDAALSAWPEDGALWYLRGLAAAGTGDDATARAALGKAMVYAPALEAARRADARLRANQPPVVEGVMIVEHPFGDPALLRAAIDRFFAASGKMTAYRATFGGAVLTAYGALGVGPHRDWTVPKGQVARSCPAVKVARPWKSAQESLAQYQHAGIEMEEAYRAIADLDARGETGALTPDYRARVSLAKKEWKLALVDVRDMRVSLFNQLGRELRWYGCRDEVLAAALTRDLSRPTIDVDEPPAIATAAPAPPTPARATFYVDNRECPDPVTVWIDGEKVGEVPPGERSALSAIVGRRTLCLMEPGGGSCGDQGTVREIYLADGWAVALHCPAMKHR
ncbi:MAG TPA: tetratricopeptide repeat protein [Kofleriaceae bacterium]|nr:tetratricopeptide repeat protein [Kofleriaceae bacterium]